MTVHQRKLQDRRRNRQIAEKRRNVKQEKHQTGNTLAIKIRKNVQIKFK